MSGVESLALGRKNAPTKGRANPFIEPSGRDATLVLIAAMVFGPYLLSTLGLRTEQLVAYPSFVVMLLGSRMSSQEWRLTSSLPIAWGALVPIGILGSLYMLLQPEYQLGWRPVMAVLDSIALGVVVAWLAAAATIQSLDPLRTFRRLAVVIVAMAALNGLVAGAATFTDVTPWLSSFWAANDPGTTSVASRALAGDRFSGVFNQPYEAGLGHSVALLLWCYLFVRRQIRMVWLLLLVVPLLVGGLLPVSKVFMIGGAPLALTYLAWASWRRGLDRRTLVVLAAALLTSVSSLTLAPRAVRPVDRYAELFGSDALYRISGGRYAVAGRGGLDDLFARLQESPFVGFGLDPQIGPFDNAVLAQMALGGMIGLLALAVVVAMLVSGVVRALHRNVSAASMLYVALLVLFVGSMLGAHPLLVNRAGSVLLLCFGALRGMLLDPAGGDNLRPALTSRSGDSRGMRR